MKPPAAATTRPPIRSESAPHTNEPTPIAIQLISATSEMALRLQRIESSMGLRKTASEKRAPMPTAITVAAAARTTQP